ncbi:dienelactone hydrolase [Massariosphaeria phaeospora]|uniref:Dienelactone hydrolase n=1 Tax=Massariosphaeria phaeospora TaxID=100035 RepID=A0A7C8MHN9_9PLEO|nr:dienelactone hydrolase [Massariosphaeria phaeospora]
MASNPMGQCCVIGVKHEGTAVGEVKKIDEIRTYFTYPDDKSTQKAILILSDVVGMDFINTQLIADQFAANGYFTVVPDLFKGETVPLNPPAGWDIQDWIANSMPKVDAVDATIKTVIKHMRGDLGVKKLGGVGYCFGGKYVCRWLKPGSLDVGYTAHPSFVDADELKGIQGPLSIAAAETDHIFPADKRHESEEILQKHTVPYQMTLFSDVSHGFAVRSDISKPREKFAKEQAFIQAVNWFEEYLKE